MSFSRGGTEVFIISVLPSCFNFDSSKEKVSRAKRKVASLCLGILYLMFEYQTMPA